MLTYKVAGQACRLNVARPYVTKQFTYLTDRIYHKPTRTLATTLRLILVISALIFVLFAIVSLVANSQEKIELIEVTVSSGDTLWSLAKSFYHANGDIREFIYTIQKLNKLTTAQIHPGQVILIPLME